tara:strand:- start:3806 stop:4207 length:402 start_codon:yes stop_codon:yes gene_type:complete
MSTDLTEWQLNGWERTFDNSDSDASYWADCRPSACGNHQWKSDIPLLHIKMAVSAPISFFPGNRFSASPLIRLNTFHRVLLGLYRTGQKIQFCAILEWCIGTGSFLRWSEALRPSAPFDIELSVDTGAGKILS